MTHFSLAPANSLPTSNRPQREPDESMRTQISMTLEDASLVGTAASSGAALPTMPSGRQVEVHIHMMSFGPAHSRDGNIAPETAAS